MATRKMTAEEWAEVYGWDWNETSSASRFWLVLLALLVIGVALGVYVVPDGLLPGTADHATELTAAQGEIDALEAEVGALEESVAHQNRLRDIVHENVETANARTGTDMVVDNVTVAILYRLQEPASQTCASFLTFEVSNDVKTIVISPMHDC